MKKMVKYNTSIQQLFSCASRRWLAFSRPPVKMSLETINKQLSELLENNSVYITVYFGEPSDNLRSKMNRGAAFRSRHRDLGTISPSRNHTGHGIARKDLLIGVVASLPSTNISSSQPGCCISKRWLLDQLDRTPVQHSIQPSHKSNWGIWVRPRQGASKKIHKKKTKQVLRIKEHVFCNATQSTLLDKMLLHYGQKKKIY
ncbi:unnamed protein product, partial [Meganyctiphanes norvegica]